MPYRGRLQASGHSCWQESFSDPGQLDPALELQASAATARLPSCLWLRRSPRSDAWAGGLLSPNN